MCKWCESCPLLDTLNHMMLAGSLPALKAILAGLCRSYARKSLAESPGAEAHPRRTRPTG